MTDPQQQHASELLRDTWNALTTEYLLNERLSLEGRESMLRLAEKIRKSGLMAK